MKEQIIKNLKAIYEPKEEYFGDWELNNLITIALDKNDKNCFETFLERYYYGPLKVIFKDEELIYDFKYSVCSSLHENGRHLYFSKNTFLRNVVSNIDDLVKLNGEEFYKKLKHELRTKKDMYRDVCNNGEDSTYYNVVKAEYYSFGEGLEFYDYALLCKKKYTSLLTGYNTFLDFIDRPIDITSFIKCFDESKLYLYTIYCLFNKVSYNYTEYGRLDYSLTYLEQYKKFVKDVRKKEKFYNTLITIVNEKGRKIVITVDDLLKKYEKFCKTINR